MSLPGRDTSDGARGPANRAAELVAELDRQARPALVIPALGRFRVLRDGEPIASTAWQSRKARDLLTILVARRSRPTTRESLFELLWPDEDPGPLGNRLSVALATAPSVLDPERRFPAEHFIRGRRDRLSLDLDHVDLGVERFRMEAAGGARLLRSGDRPGAMARFEAAEALYAGDFLEEDPYEDWAVAMLEEAQATYIAIARALASGRPNAATPTLPRGSSSASSSATRTTRAPESQDGRPPTVRSGERPSRRAARAISERSGRQPRHCAAVTVSLPMTER